MSKVRRPQTVSGWVGTQVPILLVHVHTRLSPLWRRGVYAGELCGVGAGLSNSYLREPDWFKLISDLFPALLPHEHLALIFRHSTARPMGPRIERTAEFGNNLGSALAARVMSFERSQPHPPLFSIEE